QGFYPDTISTDLHATSMNAGMMDMPTTMSKLLAIGMPLKDVLIRSTWTPAQTIGHPELGNLSVGSVADVSVWRLAEGDWAFRDEKDGTVRGKQRLIPELTLKDGLIKWDYSSRSGSDYRQMSGDYGIREGSDVLVKPPSGSGLALRNLYNRQQWFELREAVQTNEGFYAGVVANKFNRLDDAVRILTAFVKGEPQSELASFAHQLLSDCYAKLGKYAEAVRETEESLHFASVEPGRLHEAENDLRLLKTLRNVPPMVVNTGGLSRVKITRDKIGLQTIPVEIEGKSGDAVFDTGANVSTIIASEARRYGLQLQEGGFEVGSGITGKRSNCRMAIGTLKLGSAEIRNVAFMVFEDKDMHIAPADYTLKLILGAPVMMALGRLKLGGEAMQIGLPPGTPGEPNLAMDYLTPVAVASFRGKRLQLTFDSGATSTALYAGFYDQFRAELPFRPHEVELGGAGGTVKIRAQELPEFTFEIAGHSVTLSGTDAELAGISESRMHYDGNLGQDVLKKFPSVTLDFKTMRLEVEP
ncbi:MAG: aspartyl protease family protein, partial [Bryobacteraceae bacterium]|nr:aspartyl protease family protein [Bryobacteraceae bacterium]